MTVVQELIGVYDADGTVFGEVRYWLGARLGTRHCALCDITHGTVRERADWRRCRDELPAPFVTYHRDEQPLDVRSAAAGAAPAVLCRTEGGIQVLLGPEELETCGGSPEALVEHLGLAVTAAGLSWDETVAGDAATPHPRPEGE